MNELQKKQLAFLEETVNHYNSNNRCSNEINCFYSPEKAGLVGKSKGCAIGRTMSKKNRILADTIVVSNGTFGTSVLNNDVFKLCPKKIKELGQEFLYSLQHLHDNETHWDANGISSDCGLIAVNSIKTTFELN